VTNSRERWSAQDRAIRAIDSMWGFDWPAEYQALASDVTRAAKRLHEAILKDIDAEEVK